MRGSPMVPLVGNILPFVLIQLPMVPLVNKLVQRVKNGNTIGTNGANVTNQWYTRNI